MFRGLINDAKAAAGSLVLKYLARASVAVPFIIAAGFALAASTVMLVERFGHLTAYWSMAGGLAAIGLIAMLFVKTKEEVEEAKDEQAEAEDTAKVASEVGIQAPLALLGGLFTMPGGTTAALGLLKTAGRNFPLVILAGLIAMLFWPTESKPDEEVETRPQPNGRDRHVPYV